MLCIFHDFVAVCADYFFKLGFLKKNLSGKLSECHKLSNQIRTNIFVGSDPGHYCLQRLSADSKITAIKERVIQIFYVI